MAGTVINSVESFFFWIHPLRFDSTNEVTPWRAALAQNHMFVNSHLNTESPENGAEHERILRGY